MSYFLGAVFAAMLIIVGAMFLGRLFPADSDEDQYDDD